MTKKWVKIKEKINLHSLIQPFFTEILYRGAGSRGRPGPLEQD